MTVDLIEINLLEIVMIRRLFQPTKSACCRQAIFIARGAFARKIASSFLLAVTTFLRTVSIAAFRKTMFLNALKAF